MIELVVDALAATRLTRLVVEDTFPPVKALRDRIVDAHSHDQIVYRQIPTDDGGSTQEPMGQTTVYDSWAELITCPWCAGFWICLLVVVARRVAPRAWRPPAEALAFSMIAGLVESKIDVD